MGITKPQNTDRVKEIQSVQTDCIMQVYNWTHYIDYIAIHGDYYHSIFVTCCNDYLDYLYLTSQNKLINSTWYV